MQVRSSTKRTLLEKSVWIAIRVIFLLGIAMGTISIASMQENTEEADNSFREQRERLAYVTEDNDLILYDPEERTGEMVLSDVQYFAIAPNGRVAYTKPNDDPDVYVFDPSMPKLPPTNITLSESVQYYPVAWSHDGRYLAFSNLRGSPRTLKIWDGEAVINLTLDDPLTQANLYFGDWSEDGRLAFVIISGDESSDIYLWDGDESIDVSQNPGGSDGIVGWSNDGKLLFASNIDDEVRLYIWDGVSFDGRNPDVESFVQIAPELEPRAPVWVDENLIAFTIYPPTESGRNEVILWEVVTNRAVRNIPVVSEYAYSFMAEGGQVIRSSHLASGLPSLYLDIEDTNGNILFSTQTGEYSWTSRGYLAYCVYAEGGSGWALSIWDGVESWVVARVSYRPAQWQTAGDSFSCNNG